MEVSKQTKWADVEPVYAILTDKSIEALKAEALKAQGMADGFYALTIEHFIDIAGGDLKMFNLQGDGTAYEQIFLDELKAFITEYVEKLGSYTISQTSDEARASKACAEVTMAEGLLIFARGYFNLPSFSEAGRLTLADLLIAKKDAYNTAQFQRAMNKIQTAKYKK